MSGTAPEKKKQAKSEVMYRVIVSDRPRKKEISEIRGRVSGNRERNDPGKEEASEIRGQMPDNHE